MRSSPDFLFEEAKRRISRAKRVLAIVAGKGGVGKSLVSTCLALALAERDKKVGLLDLDVHGSSIPLLMGFKGKVRAGKRGFRPINRFGIEIMSIGLFTKESPVPVKGEDKMELITNLVALTNWRNPDYLIIDLPPGTGEEVLWTIRTIKDLKSTGALIVTTPSMLSYSVVKKNLKLLIEEGIRVLGLVENMSYFTYKGRKIRPFGSELGEKLAKEFGLSLLARIPIEPRIERALAEKTPLHKASREFGEIFSKLAEKIDHIM